jgi:hypothetical protein
MTQSCDITGREGREEAIHPVKADVSPRWPSLPIVPVAGRAQRSCLANEWPTSDQWHDRRTWRSCHLPGTSLSGVAGFEPAASSSRTQRATELLDPRRWRIQQSRAMQFWRQWLQPSAARADHATVGSPGAIPRRRVHTDHVPRIAPCRRDSLRDGRYPLVTANLTDK